MHKWFQRLLVRLLMAHRLESFLTSSIGTADDFGEGELGDLSNMAEPCVVYMIENMMAWKWRVFNCNY